jgi:hypothetical protein
MKTRGQKVGAFVVTAIRVVSHCGLAINYKSILRQKKHYGNSNISPCKNIIFQKILLKKPKGSFKML